MTPLALLPNGVCSWSECGLSPLVVAFCFLVSHLLSQVHRRQKQLSDFVETRKYRSLPKICGSQSSEWEECKKSRAKRGSLDTRRTSRTTVTCQGLREVKRCIIRHCRWRTEEQARRGGPLEVRFTISQDSLLRPSPVASDSCHDQASACLLGDVAETGSRRASWQALCRRSWTVCSMCHGSGCRILSGSRSWMCQCHRS